MNNKVPDALDKVKQLSEQSRETVNVLRETIWAVQENSHTLDEFVLRVRSFLQRVLPPKNIEWDVIVNGVVEKKLSANQSLQLFRIIQEATQNIIKHSEAVNASYTFNADNNLLQIVINDNGKSFDQSVEYASNGLKNMMQRMKELNGQFEINNGTGTTIILTTHL
jgi:signal transduction histidine kinase